MEVQEEQEVEGMDETSSASRNVEWKEGSEKEVWKIW